LAQHGRPVTVFLETGVFVGSVKRRTVRFRLVGIGTERCALHAGLFVIVGVVGFRSTTLALVVYKRRHATTHWKR
jgi:hypothetical protein